MSRGWIGLLLAVAGLLAAPAAGAEPSQVTVGTYINQMNEVSFKESKFSLDFYVWFRWKPEGVLENYKPLESMELINGKIENKSSVVEKKIGEMNYASARVSATIFKNWEIEAFPFDQHRVKVHIEDSENVASAMEFVPDQANSGLGEELALPGWKLSGFNTDAAAHTYKSNYGDTSLPTGSRSSYSRMTFGLDMKRDGLGAAVKLLSTVVIATLVSFVAFGIRPSNVDPRFGLGVGALFAVAASAFVVASTVPESALLTVADQMHMAAMGFIFASVVQSAFCLKWEEAGLEHRWRRLDRLSIVLFPAAFVAAIVVMIAAAVR